MNQLLSGSFLKGFELFKTAFDSGIQVSTFVTMYDSI